MTLLLKTYGPVPLLNPPRIHTDLLWDLGLLFTGITGLYFLLILLLRHRIAGRRQQVLLKKRELAPMITNFLFYRQDLDAAQREDHIRMKIEIRDQLRTRRNREVLSEVLMDLRKDVSGEALDRLLRLYQELGLHRDAFEKLKSQRWEKVAQGISELTEMKVDQAYHILKKRINDKRGIIRKQAQLAIVSLREEGIRYILDRARHRISEWQQLKMMELLKHKEDFRPPGFRDWLISENRDVVLFALRLIRHYRQGDASRSIITLLGHQCAEIQEAALECIRDFAFPEARIPLKEHFERASAELKVLVLDAFREVATEKDLPWLQQRVAMDPSFLVRDKAGMLINALKPGTILPTKDIVSVPSWDDHAREVELPPAAGEPLPVRDPSRELKDDNLEEAAVPSPDFGDLQVEWDSLGWLSREIRLPAPVIDLAALPEEDWGPEHEQIFEYCFMQELKELLSIGPVPASLPEASLDFLPLIVEKPSNTTDMEPHETTPEWLRKLDVQAEILFPKSGYAKVLREILLEDLAETEQVFKTDFVPWVTGGAQAGQPDMEPDFGVIVDDIQHLQKEPVKATVPSDSSDPAAPLDGEMNYFSIFQEFFRSYDRDSKLILLDEIPEIGTEKELHFLEGLFEDPDEQVAARARKVYALLARRLEIDPKALKNRGSQALWTPAGRKASPDPRRSAGQVDGEEHYIEEPGFIPEFDTVHEPQGPVTPKAQRRKRLFGFFRGSQNAKDE